MGYKKTNTTSKKNRGRKALFDKKRKAHHVYFNDEEWDRIILLSGQLDMDPSVYIRDTSLGYKLVIPDRDFRREMMSVRYDIKNLFTMLESLHLTAEKRLAMLTDFGFLRRWVDGVKKELDFLDMWIKRV